MANLCPTPRLQFFDANGEPLVGGQLFTYQAGTSIPLATYTDQSAGTANANPIILDAVGSAAVWISAGPYKFVLEDASGAVQWTSDNIAPLPGSPGGVQFIGAFDSQSSSPNGLVVIGTTVYAQSASATNPGMVNTGAQTFSGPKTFLNNVSAPNFTGTSSGANTGDQTITMSGDVTGSGSGAITTIIQTNAVSNSKLAQMPAGTVKANLTGSTANSQDVTLSALATALGSGSAITGLSGDVSATGPGSVSATLANVNSNVGSFTNATITVDAKGRVTAAASGTGGDTIGTIDTGTPSANGAQSSSGQLIMQSASATNPGLMNTGSQTIAGNKTYSGSTQTFGTVGPGGYVQILPQGFNGGTVKFSYNNFWTELATDGVSLAGVDSNGYDTIAFANGGNPSYKFYGSSNTPIFTLNGTGLALTGTAAASNLSGTNTGDQTISLTGDVTGSGTGSFAATVDANKITNAKLAQMATLTLKGNNTGGTANAADLTVAQVNAMLGTFSNPMTTAGDLIVGGTSGAPTRLAAGSNGNVLGFSGGQPTWQTLSTSPLLSVQAKTAAYTMTVSDDIVFVSGGVFTVTLPDATLAGAKKVYRIKKTDTSLTNIITLATVSSQTIDTYTSVTLNTLNETYDIISDGANWQILQHKTLTPWIAFTQTITCSVSGAPVRGSGYSELAMWKRQGRDLLYKYAYNHTVAGTNGTNGAYLYGLPGSLTASSNVRLPTTAGSASVVAYGGDDLGKGTLATTSAQSTTYNEPVTVFGFTGGQSLLLTVQGAAGSSTAWGSGSSPNYAGASLYIAFKARVEIAGWIE